MNTPALRNDDPPTGLTVSATFDYKGQKIPINSQDIKNISETSGIKFSLSQPVVLGNIAEFMAWLKDTLGIPIDEGDIGSAINNLPGDNENDPKILKNIKNALNDFLRANITITVLSVDTANGNYSFGVTVTPEAPITILGDIALDSIGVEIASNKDPEPD
ncbi:hypothetical protein ACJJIG_18490 [Microbulbifer sp. SSSA007]|uniref:hypothetical protein n=1 Tax=unclassified Microbulbifer TaxID=2619833 RepID=UPI0040397F5C